MSAINTTYFVYVIFDRRTKSDLYKYSRRSSPIILINVFFKAYLRNHTILIYPRLMTKILPKGECKIKNM